MNDPELDGSGAPSVLDDGNAGATPSSRCYAHPLIHCSINSKKGPVPLHTAPVLEPLLVHSLL